MGCVGVGFFSFSFAAAHASILSQKVCCDLVVVVSQLVVCFVVVFVWADGWCVWVYTVFMWLQIKLQAFWVREYKYWRVTVPVRIVSGVWLLVLTAVLYGYDVGSLWWGVLLVPAAALHFYVACRSLRHRVRS